MAQRSKKSLARDLAILRAHLTDEVGHNLALEAALGTPIEQIEAELRDQGFDLDRGEVRLRAMLAEGDAVSPRRFPPSWNTLQIADEGTLGPATRYSAVAAELQKIAKFDGADDEQFGKGQPFVHAVEADSPEVESLFDDFDLAPGYSDENQLPPYPEENLDTLVTRRSSGRHSVFAVVLAVVLIGGISFFVFRPGIDGAPPSIIIADGSPTKIMPPDSGAAESRPSKVSFDGVVSASSDQDPDTTLLFAPPLDVNKKGMMSLLTSPGGLGIAEPGPRIEPRRVRTVIVKPDGTFGTGGAVNAGGNGGPLPAAGAATLAAPNPILEPPVPPTTNKRTAIVAALTTGVRVASADVAGDRPPSTPTETATATTNVGMVVQVSSQRSEAAARATFRDLQSRYPNILGSYEVNIQRADLGARGIYFRARVGPFPPSGAQRLCDDLKAAGGDCILSRG